MCCSFVARTALVCALVAVWCEQFVLAAPQPNPSALADRQDLVQRFVEFLQEDKAFVDALDKVNWNEEHLARSRRQAGSTTTQEFEFDTPAQKEPGFFDRAAKFVTELLQRFLKWVNSSDNN